MLVFCAGGCILEVNMGLIALAVFLVLFVTGCLEGFGLMFGLLAVGLAFFLDM